MDYQRHLRELELKEQIQSGIDWDDYDPDYYGWEKSRIMSFGNYHNLEFADEIGLITLPHKTRRFRQS